MAFSEQTEHRHFRALELQSADFRSSFVKSSAREKTKSAYQLRYTLFPQIAANSDLIWRWFRVAAGLRLLTRGTLTAGLRLRRPTSGSRSRCAGRRVVFTTGHCRC